MLYIYGHIQRSGAEILLSYEHNPEMTTMVVEKTALKTKTRKRRNWAPYWLILPSVIYLALFFAWPMFRALTLAVWDEEAHLTLRAEAQDNSPMNARIRQGTSIDILDQQGNVVTQDALSEANIVTELWLQVQGEGADRQMVMGWAPESRIRVREEDAAGTPIAGTVRRKLGSDADPLTSVYAEPDQRTLVLGKLEASSRVDIVGSVTLEVWYLIRGEQNEQMAEGWARSRFIQVFNDGVTGRIDRGNAGEFTTRFIEKMFNDRFFRPALTTTLLLMVLIIPVQFVLAIVMALVIQARLRGGNLFLYIFAIPLGVSDLAVGIVWFSIFTQNGFLNSILLSLGLIQAPAPYLVAEARQWIIIAVWLAEIWRATSIVMVIVVSGLQAIPDEVLEAAEVYGAGLWQRIRFVILPMLRPSLQGI